MAISDGSPEMRTWETRLYALVRQLTGSTLPLTTIGDILTRDATNNIRLPIGPAGYTLTSDGTLPSWQDSASPTLVRGDMIARDASQNVRLPLGAAGTTLQSDGLDPVWTPPVISQRGDLLTRDASDVIRLALGTANQYLRSNGTDVLWQNPTLATQGDLLTHNAVEEVRLALGVAGSVLTSDGTDATWNPAVLTTRGDLLTRDAAQDVRLPVGPADTMLVSDGTDPSWTNAIARLDLGGTDVVVSAGSYSVTGDATSYIFLTTSAGNDVVKLPDSTVGPLSSAWAVRLVNNPSSTEILLVQNSAGSQIGEIGVGSSATYVLTSAANIWSEVNLPYIGSYHVVTVGKGADADFHTVKAALASISGASPSNLYLISLGVGIFVEDNPIVFEPNICITGQHPHTSIISAMNTSSVLVQLKNQANMSNMQIRGANGSGGIGLLLDSAFAQVSRVMLMHCETGICIQASQVGIPCVAMINACMFVGAMTNAVEMDGSTATSMSPVIAQLRDNSYMSGAFTGSAVYVHGALARLIAQGEGMSRSPPTMGVGYHIGDDASGFLVGCGAGGLATAFLVDATGSGGPTNFPKMYLSSCVATNSAIDIDIQNATTQGFISGQFDSAKISIVAGAKVATNFVDTSLTTDPRVNITGDFWYGPDWNRQTDLAPFFSDASSKGLLVDGGLASGVAADAVDVSAGSGYLETLASGVAALHYVAWPAATLDLLSTPALVNNENNYIYIDANDNLGVSSTRPDDVEHVLLGRVYMANSMRVFVDVSPVNSHVPVNRSQQYDRDVFKGLFSRGSITSTSTLGATADLQVSTGLYYFSYNPFEPVGLDSTGGSAPPILSDFTQVNRIGSGVYIYTPFVTSVTDLLYDTPTGTAAIPATQFAKHALYVVGGDGTAGTEKYFLQLAQSTHATLPLAVAAGIPTPPVSLSGDVFFEGMVPIAAVIVEQAGNIVEIDDIRPLPISAQAGSGGASTVHCDLTGLGVDCHLQYLPLTGSRTMTGSLTMGNNDIVTGTGLVDGVTVSAHAARHLPTGADPLATAAPTVTLSASTMNQTGTANAFSRSDHVHAFDTSTISHTVLQNLTADDHLQYLIRTGARPMTGTLTMGNNDIVTGTGLVDGVDVSGHASRHAPQLGADPLATAAPTGSVSSTSTNQTGTANSLARSDHSHAFDQTTVNHSALQNLLVDTHTQYLPLTGIRAMAGNLTMNNNNIIMGTGLVDGVDVSSHAARHLPTGADPLATAAPTTTLTASTTNDTGTANSFARSNHVHAIDTSTISHSVLQNLGADDHTQYALLAGRGGGQTLYGGTASGADLTLVSTAHATLGDVHLNDNIHLIDDTFADWGDGGKPVTQRMDFTQVDTTATWKGLGLYWGRVERWTAGAALTTGRAVTMTTYLGAPAVRHYSGTPSMNSVGAAFIGFNLANVGAGGIANILVDGITTATVDSATNSFSTINVGAFGLCSGANVAGRVVWNRTPTFAQCRCCVALETIFPASAGTPILVKVYQGFESY